MIIGQWYLHWKTKDIRGNFGYAKEELKTLICEGMEATEFTKRTLVKLLGRDEPLKTFECDSCKKRVVRGLYQRTKPESWCKCGAQKGVPCGVCANSYQLVYIQECRNCKKNKQLGEKTKTCLECLDNRVNYLRNDSYV